MYFFSWPYINVDIVFIKIYCILESLLLQRQMHENYTQY
jgi:hypothetical protein